MGDFDPDQGRMEDFAVLQAEVDRPLFAAAPTMLELAKVAAVEPDLVARAVAIEVVGFPQTSHRAAGRPAPRKGQQFSSRGWVKHPDAYRRAALAAIEAGVVFDDVAPVSLPEDTRPLDEAWHGIGFHQMARLFAAYRAAKVPIVYHSGDYANGSSGGGVFLESGHLLGIIPLGASPFPRTAAYAGFGQALRVDFVCARSRVLRASRFCQPLESAARAP